MALIVVEVEYMTKTVSMTYGQIEIPTSRLPYQVLVELVDSTGAARTRDGLAYGTPSFSLNVPSGTGWKIRVSNLAQDGGAFSVVESAPFDVIETALIPVVIGVSV